MKPALAVVVLLASLFADGQPIDPVLKSYDSPRYPPLARQARIQGPVQLEFFVNHQGVVVSVNILSGHPLLAPAAAENVRSWKFQMPKSASLDDQRYETVFDFELTETAVVPLGHDAKVVIDSFHHVWVPSIFLYDIQTSGCPSDKEKLPPVTSNADYVEMSRTGCLGTCSNYMVRIHASGVVDWEGSGNVFEKGRDSTTIGPALARDVIAKFDSSDFWALCGNYSSFAAGNPTTAFRVRLGNRVKTLTNYANSAPRWLGDLEYVVDDAADTHRWLHGDPREEPLSRIEDDGDGPKPGLTPLMRAAARGDVGQVKMLLKKGADVNQADASGWTVLMYARTREYGGEGSSVVNSDLIPLLLAAGADPNYSSPRGDTPLMAAAYDERFEMTLVKAGAKVNAQNADGISVLMILAAKAEAGEIERALRAGADPKLKDAQGRTALDYLNLANCAESPLQNSSDKMAIQEGDQCRSLYQDDFQKSEKLLNMSATISVP